ncbi:Protein translocase subunit [Lachnellula hyalina]|uniref:Protein translocase subunit n=1 Tax=Lachnellula hyalina TaxID=1316788 RepID=A0A8H8TVX4_9HELO|nr:Protein translocase subunit [Lachnellula hyalina]TVY24279.1 Protein translocase subunit [Lachnellula hyalina]
MANLPGGTHVLSGAEAQRLRTFCTSEVWTEADLDDYSHIVRGPTSSVRADFEERSSVDGIEKTRQSLADIHYGPTKVPLFNFLLQLTHLDPYNRLRYLETTRYLALEAKVPVDSTDLSGTTTFMYAISTKPYWDREFADIMVEAGVAINHRNRYGCVAGHDIIMASDYSAKGKKKTVDALRYFIEKGGDVNVAEGNGITIHRMGTSVQRLIPEIGLLLNGGGGAGISGSTSGGLGGKKIGRNDPCHCGSKKKFKTCCGKN